jgi:hypothetical protein
LGQIQAKKNAATSKATPATKAPAAKAPAKAPAKPAAAPKKKVDKFKQSKSRGNRGVYLQPIDENTAATYTLKINKLERKMREESTNPSPCESSIIEVEVVASNNPDLCDVGFMASIVFTDKYFVDSYYADVKGFLCALLNREDATIGEEVWDACMRDENQPFAGYLVDCVVRNKQRKDKPSITNYVFMVNEEQYPEGSGPTEFEGIDDAEASDEETEETEE